MVRTCLVVTALVFASPALAKKGHKAHEHGAARLDVGIDGTAVELRLEMPGDDAFGFERAPRTDQEKKAVKDALQTLRSKPGDLFQLPADAGCESKTAKVEAAQEATLSGGKLPEGEHADVDATYTFACRKSPTGGTLRLGLLKAFPRLKTVRIQVLSGAGQSGQTVHAAEDDVKL